MKGTRRFGLAAAVASGSLAATAGAAPPPTPPPKVSGAQAAPPPAWVEVAGRSRWLAYSSYCWRAAGKAACVDFIPPRLRPDVPVVAARRGARLRFQLGFRPTTVELVAVGSGTRKTWTLAAAASSSWRVAREGVLLLEAKGARGSASYALRLRFR